MQNHCKCSVSFISALDRFYTKRAIYELVLYIFFIVSALENRISFFKS